MVKKELILITGGARSGKSSFGESLLKNIQNLEGKVLYIATAEAFDDEMKDRIKKHRQTRPENWVTFEGYKNLSIVLEEYKNKISAIFLDCITLMITNLILQENIDWQTVSQQQVDILEKKIYLEVESFIKTIKSFEIPAVLITNEIGLGIVPENKLSRVFRDIAGRINQYIAKEADSVYFVVCGIPNKIK